MFRVRVGGIGRRPFNPPYLTDTWRLWRDTFVHRFPGEVYLPLPLRRPNHCRRPDPTDAFGVRMMHRFATEDDMEIIVFATCPC